MLLKIEVNGVDHVLAANLVKQVSECVDPYEAVTLKFQLDSEESTCVCRGEESTFSRYMRNTVKE